MLQIYLDSANREEIDWGLSLGVVSGATTNPSLLAKEGKEPLTVLRELAEIVKGPLNAEVTSRESAGMIFEGRALSSIGPNIVVKIPMIPEGLRALQQLGKEGIPTNATLVFSPTQALAAAAAGARYVSVFLGRLDDIGIPSGRVLKEVADLLRSQDSLCGLIAASIRSSRHVIEAGMAGCNIVTLPLSVLKKMIDHPLTRTGLDTFLSDWKVLQDNLAGEGHSKRTAG